MKQTKFWTWHLIAGMAILLLGGLHMIIMHMDGILGWFNSSADSVDWNNVKARTQEVMFTVVYILLLGAALYHGFYGLRNMLIETNVGAKLNKFISVVLVLLGLGIFVYGTWAAIAAQMAEHVIQ